ncbi:MAG: ornithine cyclodeaminase family protein, partial [Betaproteobacteria bacterium]|nr:ornithine cyclodeaminase family protein [Betaproteobacteria bacterium]
LLAMREVITLLEQALIHEAAGKTTVSPKFVTDFEGGSMRMLVAADHEAGYLATKAYHSVRGTGARYVVTLYRLQDGELLALLDGQGITDLRTGGASGVIARKVQVSGPVTVGVIGSGNQARTQLESLAAVYDVQSAAVFSPTAANREAYAREMSQKLGIAVTAVDSAEAAARDRAVVATASNSRSSEPILRGAWLDRCRLLCAVGNTRPQFAEADVDCFRNAGLVVVDSWHALEEAGELRQAVKSGALPEAKRASLAQIVTGVATVPREGLIAFKSVGSALQDLALASRYYELLGSRPGLPACADLASPR